MVKQTQAIRQQKLANFLSVFDHFVGLALTGLTRLLVTIICIFSFTFKDHTSLSGEIVTGSLC